MSITHFQDVQTDTYNQNRHLKNYANKEISVNALTFKGKGKLRSFPKQITIDTEEITFVETGMHYLLQKGQSIIQLFDMSDGQRNYRLQFDSSNFTWTLLKVTPLPR
jgi:hypothetical protein